MMMLATILSWDLFNANELEEGGNPFVDPDVGMRDMFGHMPSHPPFFKQNSNISLAEFEELRCLLILIINESVRSNSHPCIVSSHPLN